MKSLILYAYPPEPDGLSQQGDMLYRGMKQNGENVVPCHQHSEFQKEFVYKAFRPDVAIGIGTWHITEDVIFHPQKFSVTPVPWFVANGWVANYQDIISALPLVFTTSDWVTKTYARDGVDTRNFVTAQVGVETKLFKPLPKTDPRIQHLRKMLDIAEDEIMILTIGGDVTSKGAQEMFQALKFVDQVFPKWKYVCKVWGGGSADDHWENEQKLIEQLGDSKNKVQYLDGSFSRDFMPLLLNACDIYAAPSRLEGYGMIQVEAQACGIPVVSINEMGPKETIVHGHTGFLANVAKTVKLEEEWVYEHWGFEEKHKKKFKEPKIFEYRANVHELARYLLKLMYNPRLRALMGRNGREHILKNFEYHYVAQRMTNIIKERLGMP